MLRVIRLWLTVVLSDKNSPKISSSKLISRVFTTEFQHSHMIWSLHGLCFVLKICQTLVLSRIFLSNFWRVFDIRLNCVQLSRTCRPAGRLADGCDLGTVVWQVGQNRARQIWNHFFIVSLMNEYPSYNLKSVLCKKNFGNNLFGSVWTKMPILKWILTIKSTILKGGHQNLRLG